MLRRLLLGGVVALVLVAGGGVAVAQGEPDLRTSGPTSVTGTDATAVFEIAERTVRQVRYDDGGTLRYTFRMTNDGRLPLTLHGLADDQDQPRLFTYAGLTGPDRLGAGDSAAYTLDLRMGGCESLSSRAGSFVTELVLRTEQAGVFDDDVTVVLPEELHTGSPREAFCPESTATSRPPG